MIASEREAVWELYIQKQKLTDRERQFILHLFSCYQNETLSLAQRDWLGDLWYRIIGKPQGRETVFPVPAFLFEPDLRTTATPMSTTELTRRWRIAFNRAQRDFTDSILRLRKENKELEDRIHKLEATVTTLKGIVVMLGMEIDAI